ncbi:MAG TPA: Rho termination factor N-terminal domain-containing protein [Thermoleophilaceae bacterium]|nr:Rho termination factor N-terminal domain-containing protein [Thermoleophilaceae bacterium]
MSVLARHELEQSPLADLHALATELGIEGFRGMRREALIDAIAQGQGGEPETPVAGLGSAGEEPAGYETANEMDGESDKDEGDGEGRRDRGRGRGEGRESGARGRGGRGRGGRGRGRDRDRDEDRERGRGEDRERGRGEDRDRGRGDRDDSRDEESEETREGILDVLPNGSGFMRADAFAHSKEDVYVSPAQIRRCELRAGDELTGLVRSPRRSERYPSLVRVETVNGAPAEPPEERPLFDDLTPAFPSERLPAPDRMAKTPIGKGSRVAVSGPPGAGATTLLRELAASLGGADVEVTVVLAGVRPEELAEWRSGGPAVAGAGFDQSPDDLAQAAAMAIERAKRVAERGRDACVLIDGMDSLPAGAARRAFAAARNLEGAGSVTVAAVTASPDLLRVATTRVALEPGGVVADGSETMRAELLS